MKDKFFRRYTILPAIVAVSLSLFFPSLILAQTDPTATREAEVNLPARPVNTVDRPSAPSSDRVIEVSQFIRTKSNLMREIDRRSSVINNLLAKLQESDRLNETQKTSLSATLTQSLDNLEMTRARASAVDELGVLQVHIQTVSTTYNAYAFERIRTQILLGVNRAGKIQVSLESMSQRLTGHLSNYPESEEIVHMNERLEEIELTLNDTGDELDNIEESLLALTIDGYPANRTRLQDGRTELQTVTDSLNSVRTELRSLVNTLRSPTEE